MPSGIEDAQCIRRGRQVASRPGVEPLEQRHVPSTVLGLPPHVLVVNERDGVIAVPIQFRSSDSVASGEVTLVTSDGTARAGVHYTATQQVVAVDRDTRRDTLTVRVPILEDQAVGGPRTFQVALVDPTGDLRVGGSSAVVRIVDASDPAPPTLQDVRLLAPGRNITSIVLTFSEPMEPAEVGDVANYFLYGPMREGESLSHAGRVETLAFRRRL